METKQQRTIINAVNMIHEILKILDTTNLQELEKQRITTDLLRLFKSLNINNLKQKGGIYGRDNHKHGSCRSSLFPIRKTIKKVTSIT